LNPDTVFYDPPRYVGLFYEKSVNKSIKVHNHPEYIFSSDPITGQLRIYDKFYEDSVSIETYFGEIDNSVLIDIFRNEITLSDSLGVYLVDPYYTINLSSEDEYLSINRCNPIWEYLIIYEIGQLKTGDKVIIDFLNFRDHIRERNHSIGSGYWIIK
jgi:hypothetical protein